MDVAFYFQDWKSLTLQTAYAAQLVQITMPHETKIL